MVVDDQPDVRFLIGAILEGARDLDLVAEAATGDEALAQLADADPDVVIVDALMPRKDDLATGREILAARPGLRLVLCSASIDPGVPERAREHGFAACVSKDDFFAIPEIVRGVVGRA